MSKICFIYPPSSLLLEDRVMPALSVLMMGGLLKEHGHEVQLLDLAGVEDWRGLIKRESHKLNNADFIGYTASTPQYNISQTIRDYTKSIGYDIPSVIGGAHITSEVYAQKTDFLDKGGFDSYCVGEGFNAVLKMCDDIKESGKLHRLYSEPIWPDVNTLPYADRDLIDMQSYNYSLDGKKATTIYTSWGCPYECSYCESKMMGSFVVRMQTPQRIQDEVRYIRDRWGIYGFMDFSDELNLDRKRFLGICQKYKELGDVVWRGFLVAAKWDDEMAKAAKESNCFQIASGIESLSPTILRNIHKPATVDINKHFIKICKRNGLNLKTFMILGLPGESWKTVKETDQVLEGLRRDGYAPDDLDVCVLQVYHGSNIYRDREKLDIEFDDYMDNVDKMYYKSGPKTYSELVQVKTKAMSKYDLISARNYIETKYKKSNWIEDYTGRKDMDRIYETPEIAESIKYAEKMIANVK